MPSKLDMPSKTGAKKAKKKNLLQTYRQKRDFAVTPEPGPVAKAKARRKKDPMFVVQKHDATALHYDFRIEAEGVLKSWAVPKGPSTNPNDKRLAMPTEDHPMAYGNFEGVIPEGQYGAGPVIVWDTGTYRNLTAKNGKEIPVEEGLKQGHIKIEMAGRKLKGAYALTRTSQGPAKWLLVKIKDEYADTRRDITSTDPNSVLTGHSIEDLLRGVA
jgi:DNA ligase D-like protein (predicted 3'-phosphoesterase)